MSLRCCEDCPTRLGTGMPPVCSRCATRREGAAAAEAAIVAWLREKGARVVQDIQPADSREAEDCLLVQTTMVEMADAIERGAHREQRK